MLRVVVRQDVDRRALAEIVTLIDAARAADRRAPIGEHKLSQLRVGAQGWTGILACDGEVLAGYAHLHWHQPGAVPRAAVEVVVHPAADADADDVGRRLLAEAAAVLGRAGGGVLYVWEHGVRDPGRTLAARSGFAVNRVLAFMQHRLDRAPPVRLPTGVALRRYRHPDDEAALLEVNNAAFVGHPENGGWTEPDLAERRALPWFDPAGLLLAWRGDELLGFHWTKEHGQAVGEVYVLAIAPWAQGLGLGRALLHAGLAHLYDRGCRQVVLYVDRANAGAEHLYAAEGFETADLEVCYERRVDPQPSSDEPGPCGSSL